MHLCNGIILLLACSIMEFHIQALVAGEPIERRIEHWYIYLLGQVLERSLIRLLLMHVEVGQTGLADSSVPDDDCLERLIVCDHSIFQVLDLGRLRNICISEFLHLRGRSNAELGAAGRSKLIITLTLYITSNDRCLQSIFRLHIEVT